MGQDGMAGRRLTSECRAGISSKRRASGAVAWFASESTISKLECRFVNDLKMILSCSSLR
eukprot:SAG31_NODE_5905_length_2264_cov_1.627252_3_plen_60_part_00